MANGDTIVTRPYLTLHLAESPSELQQSVWPSNPHLAHKTPLFFIEHQRMCSLALKDESSPVPASISRFSMPASSGIASKQSFIIDTYSQRFGRQSNKSSSLGSIPHILPAV